MGKWMIIYRDKDTKELQTEKVSGFIDGSQKGEELRKKGHNYIGLRENGKKR